jgi:hypothetical protein
MLQLNLITLLQMIDYAIKSKLNIELCLCDKIYFNNTSDDLNSIIQIIVSYKDEEIDVSEMCFTPIQLSDGNPCKVVDLKKIPGLNQILYPQDKQPLDFHYYR